MFLPLIIISVSFMYDTQEYVCIKKRHSHIILFLTLVIFIFLSVCVNAYLTGINLRGGIGSRQIGMEGITKTIAEDFYKKKFDNSLFLAITEGSGGEGSLIPCRFNDYSNLSDVVVTNIFFLSFTRGITEENINYSLSKYGVVYISSFLKPPLIENYPSAKILKNIHQCDKGYYCSLKELVRTEEPLFFVYKITRSEPKTDGQAKIVCKGAEKLQ